MHSKPGLVLAFILLGGVLPACVSTTPSASSPATPNDEGLVPTTVKNIDKAWKRPDASLAGYRRILLRPITVAFARHWNPRDYGTYGLTSQEVEKIRSSLSALAQETFARVLARGGYEVVTTPGEDVLEVEAQIFDLYVNAPETRSASIEHVYVLSAGEMRILATLRDSITGTALYRASDFKRGQETGQLEWANSAWNRSEAERALTGWANQLKNALDAARAP
jgi:hypothetical protein